MNIRSRLIVLILCVLLPTAAAGVVAVLFVYSEQRDAQDEALMEAARVFARLVDNEIESSEQFLFALVGSPDLAGGDLARFHAHATAVAGGGRTTIILATPDGQMVLNTRRPSGAPALAVDPRLTELRRLAGPRGTVVSDLFYAPLAQRYDVAVQVPVVQAGAVRYYLSRGVGADEVQRLLNNQAFPASWIASVVDRNGRVIARSRHPEQFIGKSATGSLLAKIRSGMAQGTNEARNLEGRPVKAFFHRMPRSQWTVILSVPSDELREPALRASLLLASLVLLAFAAVLIPARRYATGLIDPIRRLRDAARRLGQGEVVQPYASGVMELDLVNAALVAASAEIHDAKATLERRVAEAIESTERAQRALLHSQKLEALGRLTGGVAHDFNNVLQTLTSALQLIAFERDPDKIPDRIAVCHRAVARATALVAQLRAFGRVQEAYLETVDAAAAVRSVLPLLENALPSTIVLATRVPRDAWPIRIDVTQFELALLNLVMNARDAIADAGRITLDVANDVADGCAAQVPDGEWVRVTVTDTGAGMTPEVLAKAFDPFFTTKPVDQGSGLGLAQAYGFATQSGGHLVLDSTVGVGTRASLYLPRAAAHAGAAAPGAQPGGDAARLDAVVLFADDDDLVRESVVPILEQAGATVLSVRTGDDALRLLHAGGRIDIVFSDLVMPGATGGIALARHVRERFPTVGVLLATGYADERVDLPDIAVLTKPYGADEAVQAVLRELARRRITHPG